MTVRLVAAAIAIMGLAACSPDITPETGAAPASPTASGAPAPLANDQQMAQAAKAAAVPPAEEEKKEAAAAPEAKKEDAVAPAPTEPEKAEGAKKAE